MYVLFLNILLLFYLINFWIFSSQIDLVCSRIKHSAELNISMQYLNCMINYNENNLKMFKFKLKYLAINLIN